jgi:hypothetical protein
MTARTADLFATIILPSIRRQTSQTPPLQMPRTLFDFPRDSSRPRAFDFSFRPEEDLERWDGLS